MPDHSIGLDHVIEAQTTIDTQFLNTPLAESSSLSKAAGVPVFLKLENLQLTRSFKIRGAINAMKNLNDAQCQSGVVCVSSGNHGRGIAYAAAKSAIRCVVCVSSLVPDVKVAAIQSLGAEVRVAGASQDEAQLEADRLVNEYGMVHLSAYDHKHVIAGQGTIGLEIMDAIREIDTVIVPVSGGGLISGIAVAVKSMNSKTRVVGVSMEKGAAMHASIAAGRLVEVEESPTLADALSGSIAANNQYTFRITRDLADEIVLVSEQEIAAAVRHAYWEEMQIVEGGGSVAIAAILAKKISTNGPTAAIVSGGSIDMQLHHRLSGGENVEL